MNIFRPRYFDLEELVSKRLFLAYGEKCWHFIRTDALESLDRLRMTFGPIIVNDWKKNGEFDQSGLREFGSLTGSMASMHRYGGAFDCKPISCKPKDVYDYVLSHPDEFPNIRRVEDAAITRSWFHFDVANTGQKAIQIFQP